MLQDGSDEASTVRLPERCAAVLNSCSDDTVVCGTTAARLHGMWLPALGEAIHVAAVEPGRWRAA